MKLTVLFESNKERRLCFVLDSLEERNLVDVYVIDDLQAGMQKQILQQQPKTVIAAVNDARKQAEPSISKIKTIMEAKHKTDM